MPDLFVHELCIWFLGLFYSSTQPYPKGSLWIIGVGQVYQVIHLVLASSNSNGMVGLHCSQAWTSFFLSSLHTIFLCFYVLLHACCSHAQMCGKTLVHEFHISYICNEWNLLSALSKNSYKICQQSAVKLNSGLNYCNYTMK